MNESESDRQQQSSASSVYWCGHAKQNGISSAAQIVV
jgi:hypothetical protein